MDDEAGPAQGTPDEQPNPEGMYDYYLGGHRNFAADRAAAERVRALYPDILQAAQANRAFLRRAVTYLVAQGIDQLLDLASGVLTAGNVHEVAQQLNRDARVVYVDMDPVAVTYIRASLRGNSRARVVEADARQPAQILNHPQVTQFLDLCKPVGVLMLAFLHFVLDDQEAQDLVRQYRDLLVPGSALAITHASLAQIPQDIATQFEDLYRQTTTPFKSRSREQIEPLFAPLDLAEPGIVYVPLWRPEGPDDVLVDEPKRSINLGGVGWVR